MMNPNDIAAYHRSRLALIYVRQSSPHQVLHHRESQLRQRSFQQRAADLGWPVERITVIDEDLGVSATKRHQDRTGFQNMVAEAALGHVGIILALELSRLSRSNQDWYHLLDICAVTETLLADEEALYDPRAYNDRLLLGLKGTMSEAEIHIMKQRLVEAMHAKAKRGEFCFRLPAGYEWDEANRMVKTADEQVRSSIELVFGRFEQWGTIHRVQSSMAEDGLQVPVMSGPGARLRWGRPDYAHLRRILTHPIYAGAYCYGRRQVEQFLDADQRPAKRMRDQPQHQWHVLIRDHHEPYLSLECLWKAFSVPSGRLAGRPGMPTEFSGASSLPIWARHPGSNRGDALFQQHKPPRRLGAANPGGDRRRQPQRDARVDPAGELVPLEEQDRSLWHRGQIYERLRLVEQALRAGAVGSFQLQAAIAASPRRSENTERNGLAANCGAQRDAWCRNCETGGAEL